MVLPDVSPTASPRSWPLSRSSRVDMVTIWRNENASKSWCSEVHREEKLLYRKREEGRAAGGPGGPSRVLNREGGGSVEGPVVERQWKKRIQGTGVAVVEGRGRVWDDMSKTGSWEMRRWVRAISYTSDKRQAAQSSDVTQDG